MTLTRFHKDSRIRHKVELAKLGVLIETLARMLEIEVREETCIDVFGQELTELEHHFVHHSLRKRSTIVISRPNGR